MNLHSWWLFVATTFLVSSTPGPNMLHILTRSVRFGLRSSVPAMAGCAVASGLTMAVSAAGLGAVLTASPEVFEVLRYVGVSYLVYLGVQAWRSEPQTTDLDAERVAPMRAASLFRGGFLVSASNPKLLLYSSSVIPQFIDPTVPHAPQLVVLVATFVVGDVFWYVVYAYGGERLSQFLSRPAIRRIFERAAGGIFILFGLALAFDKPA